MLAYLLQIHFHYNAPNKSSVKLVFSKCNLLLAVSVSLDELTNI